MEISISFKNPDSLGSPNDTTVSISMQDIPYSAIHRIADKLPQVVAGAYSQIASQIPSHVNDRNIIRDFIYHDGMTGGD